MALSPFSRRRLKSDSTFFVKRFGHRLGGHSVQRGPALIQPEEILEGAGTDFAAALGERQEDALLLHLAHGLGVRACG